QSIVAHAKQMLDKLSGGSFTIDLRDTLHHNDPADTDDALDLVASAPGPARAAIPVNLLSGSQRFRVAVSLALAIGQHPHGRHRCGECVIIDEGFGSLDKQGQDVMISELSLLKGLLRRILLVSHVESFAAAFPAGYRFRLEEGETRVERVGGVGVEKG